MDNIIYGSQFGIGFFSVAVVFMVVFISIVTALHECSARKKRKGLRKL